MMIRPKRVTRYMRSTLNKVVEAQNSLEFITHVRDGSILQIPLDTLCTSARRCFFGYSRTGRFYVTLGITVQSDHSVGLINKT